MRYPWIDKYLLAKRGVTKDKQEDWNWIRYHIGGKMFAAVLLDDGDAPYYINLKLDPAMGEALRSQYPDIIPGYYSNKRHWNSVKADGEVPDELLRELLDISYRLVLGGFSRAKQRELVGLSCCGTDCSACPYYGKECRGCNETLGKVFHTPDKPCAIFACAGKKGYASCASCRELPCAVWQSTRDPSFTDEAFAENVAARVAALRSV